MLEVTISYDKLLIQLQSVLDKNGLNLEDEISLVVVRGYPIKDYVPIVDFWFSDIKRSRELEILNEGDNQELLPLDWVYEELNEMNGKVITIDEGFNNLELFIELNKNDNNGYNYSMMSVPFMEKIYPGIFENETEFYRSYSNTNNNVFSIKANELCEYLDNVDNLIENEKNYELASKLAKRLLRLMN